MRTRTTIPILGSALLMLLAACGTTAPAATGTQAGSSTAEATVSGSESLAAQESATGRTDCSADTTTTATGPVNLTDAFGRTVELAGPAGPHRSGRQARLGGARGDTDGLAPGGRHRLDHDAE